jgi:sporulation protein YlmC with PRC-barrel domain
MHRSVVSMQELPIVSELGVRLGTIQDAYFDPSEQRIIAFSVEWENDLVRGPEDLLPLTQISELNADVATVKDEVGVASGLEYDFQIEMDGVLLVLEELIDAEVSLVSGERIGQLVDVAFDPQDGAVHSYEIAPSQAPTLSQPNYLLSPQHDLDFTQGALILPDALKAELIQAQKGSTPRLDVTFLDLDDRSEEPQGEADIEASRNQTSQPSI